MGRNGCSKQYIQTRMTYDDVWWRQQSWNHVRPKTMVGETCGGNMVTHDDVWWKTMVGETCVGNMVTYDDVWWKTMVGEICDGNMVTDTGTGTGASSLWTRVV